MGFKNASGYRTFYTDVSGELNVTATTDDTELVTVRNASHTLFIQRIIFYVKTDAAQSMSFATLEEAQLHLVRRSLT